jgi:hypothetical protein
LQGWNGVGGLSSSKPDWASALAAALNPSSSGCEALARDSGAYATTEDYLWLRLRACSSGNQGPGSHGHGELAQLQGVLRKNSAAFAGRPALQMLLHLLVLDCEAALVPALQHPSLRPDALHLAVALRAPALLPAVAAAVQQQLQQQLQQHHVVHPPQQQQQQEVQPSGPSLLLADYCLACPGLASRMLISNPFALLPVLELAVPNAAERTQVLADAGRALAKSGRHTEAASVLVQVAIGFFVKPKIRFILRFFFFKKRPVWWKRQPVSMLKYWRVLLLVEELQRRHLLQALELFKQRGSKNFFVFFFGI